MQKFSILSKTNLLESALDYQIRRINKDTLTEDDYTYIENYEQFTERVKRWEKPIFEDGFEVGMGKGIEVGMGKGIEVGREEGKEEERQKQ